MPRNQPKRPRNRQKANSDKNNAVGICTKAAKYIATNIGYGGIVSHELLERLVKEQHRLDCGCGSRSYYKKASVVKKILMIQHKMFCATIPKVGFQIVPPEKSIDIVVGKSVHGFNLISKALIDSSHLPTHRLTSLERQYTVSEVERLAILYANSRKIIKGE